MEAPMVALIVGLLSAATTSFGWIALHHFTRKREFEAREFGARRDQEGRELAQAQADRTRRLEIRLKYHERQINEFYAPLYSNIQLIWNVWYIGERFRMELSPHDNKNSREIVDEMIYERLSKDYYSPIHGEIKDIIKTKMFLMDEIDPPASFAGYLMHSVMEDIQRKLKDLDNINTSSVKGYEWDFDFPKDVKRGLDKAMRSYDEIIQELSKPVSGSNPIPPVS